jgi:tRNA dimethylallyltransferase
VEFVSKLDLIVITGPTATGKSALSIELAKKIGGEIVSADSMQVYKHMDIGTAKPSVEEMSGISHHMIDIVSPGEDYSVARYIVDASNCIDDIIRRGKMPILTGGTGLYIDSLLSGRVFSNRGDDSLRKQLEAEYDDIGGEAMLIKLGKVDVNSASKLHENDKKRVVRALEIFISTGKTISQHDLETKTLPPRYSAIKVALTFSDRAELYKRIDRRVDEMILKGLVSEVHSLLDMGVSRGNTSMQAIGYKELADAIVDNAPGVGGDCGAGGDGVCNNIAAAVDLIKQESRRYAKRQLSWLRRDSDIKWLTWDKIVDLDGAVSLLMEWNLV